MAASGVGQFSINVKSNLKDFYGDLTKSKRTLKELTDKKHQLQIDSAQLDKLRDKSQRIAAEMKELRQQKTEIKLGLRNVDDAEQELKNIDKNIASLNRQKLEIDAEIQPIRTANVELYKVEQEIDRINGQKVEIDVGELSGKVGGVLDDLSSKVMGLVKAIGAISFAGLTASVGVLKEAVNAASDLEQNLGGVEKLFGDSANAVVKNSESSYKTAGVSKNEYLEQATSFSASLISSLEGDQAKAAEYVDKALIDMSDNVNTFGTNANLVQNAYEGFAKGNYTMLDNLKLGFGGTQEGAKQLINTYGGLDHEVTDMAEVTFPLLIESIHNAQKAMNISGTTAKEAATTYEGSSKMMKGAWNDFLATGNTEGLAESVPIYLENLDSKLKEMTPKIIAGIKQLVKELPPKIKPVIEDIKKILEESLNSIFGEDFTKNFVEGMAPFTDIIKKIFDMLSKSTKDEKPDLSWVGSVVPNLLKLAVGLKSASLLFKGVSFASELGLKLPSLKGLSSFGKSTKEFKTVGIEDLKSLGLKMLTIAGISANIYLAAKSLQEVQKVGDLKGLQPKMLAIVEAVVGMGLLTTAIGFIADKKPDMIIAGLATIAGISANIYLAAKALQQVGQIDSDFSSIQLKIAQMALSITEIGGLALAIGVLMGTGIGAGVLIAGLLAIIGISGTMFLAAKALAAIGNMELDQEKIKSSLGTIKSAIEDISTLDFDGSIFEKLAEMIKSLIQFGIVASIVGIGNQLLRLQEIELDPEAIKTKIETIKTSLVAFSTFGFDDSVFEKLDELLNSLISLGIVGNIVSVGNQLIELQKLELEDETIKKNTEAIKSVLSNLSEFGFDGSVFAKIAELFNSFISRGIVANIIKVGEQLTDLQKLKLDEDKVEKNINTIKKLIKTTTSGSLVESINNFVSGGIKAGELAPALAVFYELKKIGDILVQIQSLGLTEKSLTEKINIIKNAIDSISAIATDDIVNNLTGMSSALDLIVDNLTQKFPPEFNQLGQLLAKKLNEGFRKKIDLQTILAEKIRNLSTSGAENAGTKIAEAINSSLKSNLNIGDTIRDAINSALQEKYSTKIDVDLVTTETKKSSSDSKKKTSKTTKASGGLITVPSGHKAVIQDSPEKPELDNGEYVIPEKIVSALGVPFFEKLRSGQISRTFAGLAQSVSHTTSSVVNNIYHNTNTQNLNLYATGNQDLVLQGNRRFRKA